MNDQEIKNQEDKITNIVLLLNAVHPLLIQIKKEMKSIDVNFKQYKLDSRPNFLVLAQKRYYQKNKEKINNKIKQKYHKQTQLKQNNTIDNNNSITDNNNNMS